MLVASRLLVVLLTLLGVGVSSAQSFGESLAWLRMDTEIVVLSNGDLRVAETSVIRFIEGKYSFATREIDRRRLVAVRDVEVFEDGQPLRFKLEEAEGDRLRIKYYFSRPAVDEQRTFTLRYTVSGGLRYYPDGDQVYWTAVYAERGGFAVQNARVTVRLPGNATAMGIEVYGVEARVSGQNEGIIVAEALSPIPDGRAMEVRVRFPHGIVGGEPAPWQYQEDVVESRNALIALLLSLLISLGGMAAMIVIYYRSGHERGRCQGGEQPSLASSEPSPELVAALIEGRAGVRAVMALLVDLARRDVLKFRERSRSAMGGLMVISAWEIVPGERMAEAHLQPHEQAFIAALGVNQGICYLSGFQDRLGDALLGVQDAIDEAMVQAGYYAYRPNWLRAHYRGFAKVVIIAVLLLVAVALNFLTDDTKGYILYPLNSISLICFIIYLLSYIIPLRTPKGNEVYKSIKNIAEYIKNINFDGNALDSFYILYKYLPYAIAFGLEQVWLSKFVGFGVQLPHWYTIDPPSPAQNHARSEWNDIERLERGLCRLHDTLTALLCNPLPSPSPTNDEE